MLLNQKFQRESRRIFCTRAAFAGRKKPRIQLDAGLKLLYGRRTYFAALAALMASISMGVTLNRSPQMP